uniref:Uncharacterized protein n=1 Tax=Arundo donax TaxID=35708 RepID=A0A0A9SPQ6_ARUDO
MSPARLPARRG